MKQSCVGVFERARCYFKNVLGPSQELSDENWTKSSNGSEYILFNLGGLREVHFAESPPNNLTLNITVYSFTEYTWTRLPVLEILF